MFHKVKSNCLPNKKIVWDKATTNRGYPHQNNKACTIISIVTTYQWIHQVKNELPKLANRLGQNKLLTEDNVKRTSYLDIEGCELPLLLLLLAYNTNINLTKKNEQPLLTFILENTITQKTNTKLLTRQNRFE